MYTYMDQYGRSNKYDFYDASCNKDPDTYPYSFSMYWLKKPSNKTVYGLQYMDRMVHDENYKHAVKESGIHAMDVNPSFEKAKIFIDIFYDKKYNCVGLLRCCNVSSGYPILVFCLEEKGV